MHISTLVDDVQKVLDNLSAEHGEFVLAMLYNSDSLSTSYNWHLIVSAPWTDKMGMVETIHLIAHALHDGMNVENQPAISRVRVLKTSDPFVQDMTFLYPAVSPGAGVPISHVRAGEISEGSGFIFHSRKPAIA
jgi:hypothetical protein